jgi:hypothetical protein
MMMFLVGVATTIVAEVIILTPTGSFRCTVTRPDGSEKVWQWPPAR